MNRELLEDIRDVLARLNEKYGSDGLLERVGTELAKPEPFICGSCGVCIERTVTPARKPLSDKDVSGIYIQACKTETAYRSVEEFARLVQKAHGIE